MNLSRKYLFFVQIDNLLQIVNNVIWLILFPVIRNYYWIKIKSCLIKIIQLIIKTDLEFKIFLFNAETDYFLF